MKIWQWEQGQKPYFVNKENGIEWYVDKSTTDYCKRWINDSKPLNAVVFILAQKEGDKRKPITRILLCKETNEVLADEMNLEALAVKIDFLRIAEQSKE